MKTCGAHLLAPLFWQVKRSFDRSATMCHAIVRLVEIG
jgi:hypothetical protein